MRVRLGLSLVTILAPAALLVLMAAPSHAASTDPRGASTPRVAVAESANLRLLVESITNVDIASHSYDATFYLGLTCSAACRDSPLSIVNATRDSRQQIDANKDSTWWKVSATLLFTPDVRSFPFDTQQLPIAIESSGFDAQHITFVVDDSDGGIQLGAPVPGWTIGAPSFTAIDVDYPMLDGRYSEARFTVPIHRSVLASTLLYFVPLSAFLILAFSVRYLAWDIYIRVAGAGLVGLTVFYLATAQRAGQPGTLTMWDLCIAVTYIILSTLLVCGVIGSKGSVRGRYEGEDGAVLLASDQRRCFLAAGFILVIGVISTIAYAVT